ncbi:MAG: serine/threonine protein kinase [Deltaproteobacteria bacterium]|nr:serine/threonine protein kinase [Deltaproteobacteria bacterium]
MGAPSPSPDDSGVVPVGSVLDGRYRIDAVLGKGGMGRVYKGEHTGIGKAVAIKVLHANLGRSREATQRFQREALASGRLDHPNIVGVSDFGVLEDGSLYLVMEALEGEALGARLEREKRIPWLESLEILRGVLAGLRHAHDRGVVHRDIKPDNIFLAVKDGDRVIKILDFGIAKLYAGNADDPATTRAGLTVGTPAYLSPEQAVGGAITPASDLYSTSVVLYEMLTGRPPFEDTDPLAMLTAHVSRDVPSFAEAAPDLVVPPGLEQVIQRGLAKVSSERIQSATEYMEALDQVLRSAGIEMSMMSRSSGSYGIPTPPAGVIVTPTPGSLHAHMMGTPARGLPASVAQTMSVDVQMTGDSVPVARPSRPSIADAAPLPKKYGVFAVLIVIAAIATALYVWQSHDGKGGTATAVVVPVPVGGESMVDKETRFKAALHDLEAGKTCADRKAAIPVLVELGDARAIPDLRRARYRGTGGVLGIGESNANQCLKTDAEKAIQTLTPSK